MSASSAAPVSSTVRSVLGGAALLLFLYLAIPADVEDVNKGTLPKDLNGKLKRIEKLCKQLRSRRCGIVNSDGSEPPRRKGLRNEWSPRWAPDGHAVAFLPEGEVASDKTQPKLGIKSTCCAVTAISPSGLRP